MGGAPSLPRVDKDKLELAPVVGAVPAPERRAARQRRERRWPSIVRYLLFGCALIAAILIAARPAWYQAAWSAGGWSVPLLLVLLEGAHQAHSWLAGTALGGPGGRALETGWAPDSMRRRGVAYASSEHDAGQKLPAEMSIEDAIAQHMPLPKAASDVRRREVIAALEASGFRLYTANGEPTGNAEQYVRDGLKCGELSGGQKHLIYLLSVLASRPRLLICDECLCGLDIDRQSSFVQLLQKLQLRFGMAIVFLTVDLTSFTLMAHDAAFMSKRGRFLETGTAHDLVEKPQRKDTQVYVQLSEDNEQRSHGKNLRQAYQKNESVFSL